ncbi:MAG: Asp-tRNA(Asn)/Glu-tRNA(Gln) amidotransferase subunit GatC [Candidatus Omnitrophica bacterium]|nr:Asp-tRNA(Asn)/Glu-tRNA(Gln) amidotransferase subunit GatC [Candidatus Omnitrophota bacterium]MDD5488404.1 Asp-tRNA(Asn)/Glu-tRNA(Gln) amidotransferase subunit GatC [Candidatus Omnitrophota bacterium]
MDRPSEKNNKITADDVRYVAQLGRLSLDENEVSCFQGDLSRILGYIEQLNEVDVNNVNPTTHVLPSMKNVFREDEERPSIPVSQALQNAPDRKGSFFRVPRVIKES